MAEKRENNVAAWIRALVGDKSKSKCLGPVCLRNDKEMNVARTEQQRPRTRRNGDAAWP